jgi:hypothetical protein
MPIFGLTKGQSDFGREPCNRRFAAISIIEALMAFCHNKVSLLRAGGHADLNI